MTASTQRDPDHGAERYRRARLTTVATLFAHGINVLTQLAIVPLALHYLGEERYGVWAALMGAFALLAYADLGFGVGLQNAVAEAHARDDRRFARQAVSTTVVLLAGIALALVAGAWWLLPLLDIADRVGAESPVARAEAFDATRAIFFCLAFGLPASLSQRILNGLQEGWIPKLFLACGRLASLLTVWLSIRAELGMPWLAGAYVGLPFVGLLLAWGWILVRKPWLLPRPGAVHGATARRILRTGSGAFFVQVALILAGSGMPIVLGGALGAAAVPPYAVTARMLWLPTMMVGAVAFPLWPAFREAVVRGDHGWVRGAFARTLRIAALVQGAAVVFSVLLGPWFIELWTGRPEVVPDLPLLVACCAWSSCLTWSVVCMTFLNSLERMRWQALHGLLGGGLALYLVAQWGGELGLADSVWVLVLVCGLPRSLLYGWEVRHELRRMGGVR